MEDMDWGPNPVIQCIDNGHYSIYERGREVCKMCKVSWPCEPIVEARDRARIRGAAMAAPKSGPVIGVPQGWVG